MRSAAPAAAPAFRVRTTSDAEGRFAVAELDEGRYVVSVRAPGFAPDTFGPFLVASGDAEPVELVLEAGATLSGAVSRPGVDVVPDDMDLVLRSRITEQTVATTTTEAGRYRFADLPAGNYVLLVAEPSEGGSLGIARFLVEELVELSTGEARELDVLLP